MSEGSSTSDAAWREERTRNAAHQAAELERRRAAETEEARELVRDFVARALADGVPTTRLVARGYRGSGTYRTAVEGWYLRKNQSVGVGTDGEFYVLSVEGTLRARLRGAQVRPSDPPLVLGQGARDGESIDLVDALERALTGTTHGPA